MAGREREIEAFDLVVARTELSRPARSMVLTGLRGVGKTVLLNRLRGIAENHDWLTIRLEGRTGKSGDREFRRDFARELQIASRRFASLKGKEAVTQFLRTVTSFSAGIGITGISLGVQTDPARATSGSLDIDLRDLVDDVGAAMRSLNKGVAVFIDEMQDLGDETLSAFVAAQHYAGQRELPFFVVGAGLPNLPGRLAEARSYAERLFEYRPIGKLNRQDAEESFTVPAGRAGGEFEHEALDRLVQASGCYPYFIQEFGSALWEVAISTPFTQEDAETAVAAGLRRLDAGFFPSRWDRATPRERDYMNAMAKDGEGPSGTGEIASRLGRKVTSLGKLRGELVSKGLIYSPEYGRVAFTVPGMADFIERQNLELPRQ
ncbi:hypothetical protein D477_005066 [Arthrobacter crystallopoietes BAB-32]|uniref:Orc1-like AAA ATPase domain-containing protein n=1 Tax=Arthrobacter crystallopoietes BAB-32 TaxID=1246476 RepID=N1V5G8_9MICC|nr:hypothetical protein D477_005066 [Arthrobacter crystallopoietes BAB-32]